MPVQKVIFEQFDGGLQKGWHATTTTNRARKNQKKNGIAYGCVNPFVDEGVLVPGIGSRAAVTNEGTIAGTVNRIRSIIAVDDDVIDTTFDASIYFGQDDDFHAMTTTGVVQTSSWPKTLADAGNHTSGAGHTNKTIDKILDYQVYGTRKQLVFFRDDTDWDAATWDGTTFTTEGLRAATGWNASMVEKTQPIIAITSDNSYCYFGNRNSIHKFDGTSSGGANGTITGNVLTFSANREIVDMVDGLGKIWILTRPAGKIGQFGTVGWPSLDTNFERSISVLVWGRTSTVLSMEDNIIIDGCSNAYAIYIHDGKPYVWTKAPDGTNQLRMYNGTSFEVVTELGKSTIDMEGIPLYGNGGSISQYLNGFLWQDRMGNVFWHGTVNPSVTKEKSTYWISSNSDATSSNYAGAILTLSGQIFTTWEKTSVIKLRSFSPLNTAETTPATTIYTSAIELPKLSTINGVTIFFNENASADTGTTPVKIYNSWKKATGQYVVTKYIDHDVDIPRGWVYFPLAMENSNLVQLSFGISSGLTLANAPQITRIEVEYTPTTKVR